jgi:hypothetical protein
MQNATLTLIAAACLIMPALTAQADSPFGTLEECAIQTADTDAAMYRSLPDGFAEQSAKTALATSATMFGFNSISEIKEFVRIGLIEFRKQRELLKQALQ